MRCEEAVKILEILRLTEQGYSQREIATSVKCGKSTVGEIQNRCRRTNLQYVAATAMSNDEIKQRLYLESYRHSIKEDPNWPAAYFGNIRTPISVVSGQHNGNIRTL